MPRRKISNVDIGKPPAVTMGNAIRDVLNGGLSVKAAATKRSTPTPQQQPQTATQQQQQQQQTQQSSPQQQQPASAQPSPQVTVIKTPPPININEPSDQETTEVVIRHEQQPLTTQPTSPPKQTAVPRTVSLPTSPGERYRTLPANEHRLDYSQSERLPNRPKLARSISRKEAIKNFVKKETANFFGVEEGNQNDQQLRWLDRRKRLASRTYGPLKAEYRIPSGGFGHRRAVSEITGVQTIPGRISGWRPDVLPGPSDVPDSVQDYRASATVKRKESVARMTWDGLSYVITTLTRHRPRLRSQVSQQSRSFAPGTSTGDIPLEDDVFFEKPATSPVANLENASSDEVDAEQLEQTTQKSIDVPLRYTAVPGWKRTQHVVRTRGEHQREVGGNRIFSSLLDSVLDNSDRRQYGMGWVGRMFGRSMRRSVAQDEDIQQQLDDMEDHRPMFTYWVTTVQILVLIISLICYGFGPFGIDMRSRSGQVLVPSLSLQQVDYMEPANFWFGPRAADLIHLGAKFAPCMRIDDKIQQQIEKTRTKERETACCIRNDDSGCVQSSRADCSNTISTWKKWTPRDAGPGGRISGSVCGLDPKYCDAPASVHPYEWPDDITKWPICRKTNMQFSVQKQQGPKDKSAEHMICEVIGHPCCIGIHGMCKITTKEYCDFVRGNFHEEASLCSQVSCLDDVCGMVPFYFPEVPDQFYRLWTSLFLHAGILQLLVTVVIQYFLMRDLEKLTGSLRIGIIYVGSGIAGNLASAIFVPYRADVGPSGSHFGLLACLIVEVLSAWPMLKHPNQALCKLLSITLFLFVIGLMPWVDNYAHLFGFVFGFLLSYALLPFITFGPYDRQKKIVLIWVTYSLGQFVNNNDFCGALTAAKFS
ncbi:hypothetical protein RN001_013834 [Aquatica leii]|uniref:Peptidase S54 rhomboid domain-containing protein n=1 Tax=Aquatica leii TaxID=1421715 RepID=A0AAN7PR47_9COLE|nr:hypothetical protein RN001_013834 [Aquatica leii]